MPCHTLATDRRDLAPREVSPSGSDRVVTGGADLPSRRVVVVR